MSKKRSETSRKNGAKGKGPISREGQDRIRFNAQKLGLYSADLIIPGLDETSEALSRCRKGFISSFKPDSFVEEALCEDAAQNWWRRQRVRRCESKIIATAVFDANFRSTVEREEKCKDLQRRFFQLLLEKERARPNPSGVPLRPSRGIEEIDREIGEVRIQLRRLSGGLEYLIGKIRSVKDDAAQRGLTITSEVLLGACLGVVEEYVRILLLNKIVSDKKGKTSSNEKKEVSENTESQQRDKTGSEAENEVKVLCKALDIAISELDTNKQLLERLEKADDQARSYEAAVLASEKLSHAETRYDRRLYKAYVTLYTIKFQQARMALPPGV